MEHLLSAWPGVAQQLKAARHILLLTDYDGTLTPIVERPELANLPENTRRLLQALARQRRLTLGVISGRALSDLKNKVNISDIIYAGNHGLEIEGPGVRFINPLAQEIRPIIRILYRLLSQALYRIRGTIVEDKGLTLSVHYRLVERDKTKEVKEIVERSVGGAQAMGIVKTTPGKEVYEVRPDVNWDKGKAVKLLMKKYGKGGRMSGLLPLYLGDDLTDEDGFAAIQKYGGISVFVGEAKQNTAAGYYLKSPAEVVQFLGMLLEAQKRSQ
ncbi:MAG: trehalose-phosphatase [Chloroflexota bacterium]|nr:trehalose-phosphatase [Chloroflexota bacterium]